MGRTQTLVQFQSNDQASQLMQNSWAAVINPVLRNPIVNGIILDDVVLATGSNTISHTLARQPQGWIIMDTNAAATIYRSAAFNPKTLTLTASAPVTVSLYVF